MGYTWSIFTQTAILCILLALPELGWCQCSLGGNHTGDVARRNNTILYYMNSTAMSLTSNSDRKISNHSSFQLWNYIQKTFSVTSKNYLVEAVSLGLLVKHDWLNATRGYTTNWTDQRTLEAYIRSEFLDPMHNILQDRAVYYSFSLGIFRPQQEQYNYTGVNASIIWLNWENDGTRSPLQLNCVAGSRYLWRLSTSMEFDPNFDDRRTARFARSANMIENSFDQYYRKHEILGPDFVRVNVLNATNASNYVAMFMEAYFANSTYTAEQIMNLTDMSQVPKMYFNNRTSKPIPVTLRDAQYTYIATATIVVIPTTTGSTTASTEMASTAAVNESTSTTVVQTTSTHALTTTTTLESTTTSTTSTTTISTTTTTTAPVTLVVKNTEENTTTVSPSVVTESTTSSSTPTTSTSPPVTNTSDTTIVATTAANNSDSSNSSTLAKSTEFVFEITSIVSESNLTDASISTPSAESNGQGNKASATTSNPNGQKVNTTTSDGLNTTGNGNAFGNQSTTAGPGYGNGSATTFDPDPLFLAHAPVIKKLYNDEALLAKISKTLSITSKVAFTTITIPVALVTILFVICCLVCWQIDCCPASKKEKVDPASRLLN